MILVGVNNMIDIALLELRTIASPGLYSCNRNHLLARHLLISLLAISTFVGIGSLACAAELFPYSPPSATQQRSMMQRPSVTPELSSEERVRIAELSAQAKKLSVAEQQQLKEVLRKNLASAGKANNWAQVQYYSEALRQLE